MCNMSASDCEHAGNNYVDNEIEELLMNEDDAISLAGTSRVSCVRDASCLVFHPAMGGAQWPPAFAHHDVKCSLRH